MLKKDQSLLKPFIILMLLLTTSVPGFTMGQKALNAPYESRPSTTTEMLWIGKSDETKSCGKDRGIELEVMAGELHKARVQIAAKKKIYDSKMRIQSCGADRGVMNGFLIPRKDIEKATSLGFKPISVSAQKE